MAFGKKSILGTDYKQISSITEAQGTASNASLFNKIIWMIKSWCNTTFAVKSHTHSNIQPPSWPAYPKRTRLIQTDNLTTALNWSWTAPANCWIRVVATGSTNTGSMHEHVIYLRVTSSYSDGATVSGLEIFRAWFARDFYRSDATAVIPIRKGDTIKIDHSCYHDSSRLGFQITIDQIYTADSNNV